MFPFELLNSEASAANLLEQVRWREGLECPRCRSDSVIKHGSYREYQRYLCKDCDRTFNDKTGTIFAHAKIGLDKLLFAFYSFLRFNRIQARFQRVAERAEVRVRGETPTSKIGRRFWCTAYANAQKQFLANLDAIAADPGSSDASVV